MTAISKTSVKAYFQTGDRPTQAEFEDLVDSYQDVNPTLTYLVTAASAATSGQFYATNGTGGVALVSADKMNINNNILNLGVPVSSNYSAKFGDAIFTGNVAVSGSVTVSGNISGTGGTFGGDVTASGWLRAGKIRDYHYLYVETVSARSYDVALSTPYAYTLRGFRRITKDGSCTVKIFKNTTELTSAAATTAAASAAVSSNFTVGSNLSIEVTAAVSASGLVIIAEIERAL